MIELTFFDERLCLTELVTKGISISTMQMFLALCLRLVVVITNYERGDNPGSTITTM